MKQLLKNKTIFMMLFLGFFEARAQTINNRGTEFWVGYGHTQQMEDGSNGQDMVLYFNTGDQPSRVKVYVYNNTLQAQVIWLDTLLPANFVFASNPLPKAGPTDSRLFSLPCSFVPPGTACGGEGLFKRAILIKSTSPIAAYAHIYTQANSGATMLLPVESWGHLYVTANSKQSYATNCYSWMYVIAQKDSTWLEITPSQLTRGGGTGPGQTAGTPFVVKLNRGEIYQIMAAGAGDPKPELTGTRVKTLANNQGECYPVAVFAGSSRTLNPQPCGSGGGDLDNQQCFPTQVWGKRYLTAPTSSSNAAGTFMTNSFKIIVKDPTTVVKRNGVVIPQAGLLLNSYYEITGSNTPEYFEADKPIMVAQFMTGGSCLGGGGLGDPEMIYLSPIEQGINSIGFFRNNRTAISVNYLTLIIPDGGVPTLRINGSSVFDYNAAHPRLPGFRIIVKRWGTAALAPVTATSDSNFVAITYGLGSVESYGFNAGTKLVNLNAISSLQNANDTTRPSHNFNCKGSPLKIYGLFTAYQPTKLVWALTDTLINDKITDASGAPVTADVIDNNPVFIDSVIINGIRYYRYECAGLYIFNDTGTIYVPVYATHPLIENCKKTELLLLPIRVAPKPDIKFTALIQGNPAGCILDTAYFVSDTASITGLTFRKWLWEFPDGITSSSRDTFRLFSTAGVKSVKLTGITTEGCLGDTTIDITVYDKPTAQFSINPNAVCLGSPVSFTSNGSYADPSAMQTWYWDFGNGQTLSDTAVTPHSVTYPNYGTYTVRHAVGVSNLCVSDTVPLTVTVFAKPNVGFGYPAGCLPANGIVQFTSSSTAPDGQAINPASYNWTFGDPNATPANPNSSTQQNPTHLYAVGNYTITFSASTVNGCQKDTSVNASFNLSPALDFPTLNPVCGSGTPVSVALASCTNNVPGRGIYAGPGTDTAGMLDPVIAGAGVHTIWYVYTTTGGCKDSVSQTVQVRAKPRVNFGFQTGCRPPTGFVQFFDSTTISDFQSLAYSWNFGDTNSTVFNPNISNSPFPNHRFREGTYNVTLRVTTNFGCVDSITIPVTVKVRPTLSYPALSPVCQSDTAAVISTAVTTNTFPLPGTGIYSGSGVSSSGVLNAGISGPGTHTIKYIFTTAGGCTDSISQTIQVREKPQISFTYPSGCLPTDGFVQFANNTSVTDGQTISYNWDFGDNNATPANPNTSVSAQPSHNFGEGTFNISLTATTNNNCVSDTIVPVTFSLTPVLSYPALQSHCENESTGISIATAAATNAVTGSGVYAGPGTTSAGVFTPSAAGEGTHTITFIYTTTGGCVDSITQTIQVYPKPDAAFGVTADICENEQAVITDASSISTGSITSWNWYYSSGGSDVFNNGNPFNTGFPGFGNYTVKLVAVSDQNCISDTITKNVAVHALPRVDFQPPAFVCMPNGTAQFQNTTQSPDNAPVNYIWDFGDGSATSTDVNPSHVYTTTPASVTVTLTATSSFGCQSDTFKVFSDFYDKPQANFTVTPNTLCQGITNIFTDASTAPNSTVSSWQWNFGDGTLASSQNPTHRYNSPGSYDIQLVVQNAVGCASDPHFENVQVYLQPIVDAGWSFVVPEGTVIKLNPSVNDSTVLTFLWTPQGDIPDPTVLRPVFAAMTDQVYMLTALGAGGCFASDTMYVKILKPFIVPNVFSPNGDNIHDTWVIKNLADYPGAKVDVYNRYGQPVFSSVGYSTPWNGTFKGKPLPVGTYYYIIKPRNELDPVTGSVTIIR